MKNYKSLIWAVVVLSVMHWRSAVSAQTTKVAIGYSGISADQLVIWVAKDVEAKTAKPEDFIDARFVEEFDKSGYIDSLYGKK